MANRGADGWCVSQSRASSLVKEFENTAPVWLAKRRPALPLFVSIRVFRGSIISAYIFSTRGENILSFSRMLE
jgi:hypothetical protein